MSSVNLDIFQSRGGVQVQSSVSHTTPGANTKIARMKKLNIFSAANRKRVDSDRKNSTPVASPTGDTINRIVTKKEEEKLKWQKEQEEFNRKKRDHEIQLVEIERQEVQRREEEVRRRNEDLDESRRKHRLIQDAVAEQIRVLNEKLDEYRIDHRKQEEDFEDEISGMEDRLAEVKSDLETRMKDLEIAFEEADPYGSPSRSSTVLDKGDLNQFSIPSAPIIADGDSSPLMNVGYPKLSMTDGMLTLDNSTRMFQQSANTLSNGPRPSPRQFASGGQGATSVGSSPLSSHSESSRSITPKTDQTDADNCV